MNPEAQTNMDPSKHDLNPNNLFADLSDDEKGDKPLDPKHFEDSDGIPEPIDVEEDIEISEGIPEPVAPDTDETGTFIAPNPEKEREGFAKETMDKIKSVREKIMGMFEGPKKNN